MRLEIEGAISSLHLKADMDYYYWGSHRWRRDSSVEFTTGGPPIELALTYNEALALYNCLGGFIKTNSRSGFYEYVEPGDIIRVVWEDGNEVTIETTGCNTLICSRHKETWGIKDRFFKFLMEGKI